MGALANIKDNLKESKVVVVLNEAFETLKYMISLESEVDENTIEAAIENTIKENPEMSEELGKVAEIVKLDEQVLSEMQENILDYSNTFGKVENIKDEDGYDKIQDKLDIEAKVSEEEALRNGKRDKGGKEKTRVDED